MKSKFNQSNIKLAIATAILVGSTGISTASYAENVASGSPGELIVNARVAVACTLGTSTLAFGDYSSASVSTASATLSATCTSGASVSLKLSNGSNSLGDVRRMKGGAGDADYLTYDVYLDNDHENRWGSTATGETPDVHTFTSTGAAATPTVYGMMAASQTSATGGSYSDSITITAVY
ncbi:spore coat U domain-containing protein [Amylibacter sp.]|nr:spore coat U domain-containing protein [Amylibacter sp.]